MRNALSGSVECDWKTKMRFAFVTGSVAGSTAAIVLVSYFIRFINETRGLDVIDKNILPSTSLLAGMAVLLIYGWLMLGAWMTQRLEHIPRKTKVKNDEKPARDPMFPYPIMTNVGFYFLPLWVLVMFFIVAGTPATKPDVLGLLLGAAVMTAFAYGLFYPGLSFIFGLLVRAPVTDQVETEDGIR
jgi:hypothetical protein